MTWMLIGLAGAAGALARFGLGGWLNGRTGAALPWGTLTANLAGSLLLGLLTGMALGRSEISPVVRVALGTGFLGAFTTFSTWQAELFRLLTRGASRMAWAYLFFSTGLGLLAAWLGLVLGWRL